MLLLTSTLESDAFTRSQNKAENGKDINTISQQCDERYRGGRIVTIFGAEGNDW